jgi:uncharacterized membrane protein
MSPRTVFLSKLIGLFCILGPGSIFVHRQATVDTITTLVNTPAELFLVGVVALAAGLAMVIGHNIWSGGAATVLVTLIGWLTLVRGLAVFYLTPDAIEGLFDAMRFGQFCQVYAFISLLIGAYLTYAGFKATGRRTSSPS